MAALHEVSKTSRTAVFLHSLSAAESFQVCKTALKLRNARTGCCIPAAAVASLKKVVRNTRNHSAVVTAKFERRENTVKICMFCKHCP